MYCEDLVVARLQVAKHALALGGVAAHVQEHFACRIGIGSKYDRRQLSAAGILGIGQIQDRGLGDRKGVLVADELAEDLMADLDVHVQSGVDFSCGCEDVGALRPLGFEL